MVWWGLVTGAYFKSVDFAEPLELLALRVLTGLPLLIVFLSFRAGGIRDLLGLIQTQPIAVLVAGALIGLNWGTFIYAVVSSRLTEASLGYYINPLLSVLLGVFGRVDDSPPLAGFGGCVDRGICLCLGFRSLRLASSRPLGGVALDRGGPSSFVWPLWLGQKEDQG